MTRPSPIAQRTALAMPMALAALALAAGACEDVVTHEPVLPKPTSECSVDDDCDLGQVCSLGECVPGCRPGDHRCPPGEICIGMECYPEPDAGPDADEDAEADADAGPIECPDDMVAIENRYCMDRYEASRPNATDVWQGDDNSMATSRESVLPWYPVEKASAQAACAAAGKRLCKPDEFLLGCGGPLGKVYAYGNMYVPWYCNGIDTYCSCGSGSLCDGLDPCPYPHCFNTPPPGQSEPAGGCGSAMHVMPTGSFETCVSDYGLWDISGNVWELVDDGSATGQYRGGAFNCIDSQLLHRCDYVAGDINAKGFRCCK